jgi:hypothetical protein
VPLFDEWHGPCLRIGAVSDDELFGAADGVVGSARYGGTHETA